MDINQTYYQRVILTNLIDKVSFLANNVAGMAVKNAENYVKVDCGLPADTFNIIVLQNNRLNQSEEKELKKDIRHFQTKKFPMAFWYWEDGQDLSPILEGTGLAEAEMNVAMLANVDQLEPVVLAPEGFVIRQVSTAEDIRVFGEVLASLFPTSQESSSVRSYYEQLSSYPQLFSEKMKLYLGAYKEEIVSIGSLVFTKESVGIYDIATRSEYRGRGLGSAMFNFLVMEVQKQKIPLCVLQASPDGINIYKRSGFQSVGQIKVFENRHLVEE
ncbi:GNAT family N-acetyltransferase [Brevibacillus halotolerans]|uniref:GNAT family N-acetyltransferase n=1 Tax=Brevibacillus TaxID=55080 RepID=UPI00215C39E0|nr:MULTISPECIES: GNAT family N-acetyltransferase [Brevibacillus]MCR8964764.1 GNAT family N-acetyltransferase [Brevibacillus laterosporus]MCZ0836919.1 GNAT family N-acetyltransferase [Brevibacillus halotolerans]